MDDKKLEARKKKAITNYEKSTPLPVEDDCVEKGQQLRNIVWDEDKQEDDILECLNSLHLPDGYKLHVKYPEKNGYGDNSTLYVATPSCETCDVFETIIVDDTPMGAMEVYLLYEMWHYLPLFWHANYASRTYIYTQQELMCVRNFHGNPWFQDVSPVVTQKDGKYYVSCCYWSAFGGLIRELVEIEIKENKVVNILEANYTTLYDYDCGIRF